MASILNIRSIDDELIDMIKQNEGFIEEPKKIEYKTTEGDKIKEVKYTVGWGQRLSDEEYQDYLNSKDKNTWINNNFMKKYNKAKEDAGTFMSAYGLYNQPIPIRKTLIEMSYNMGLGSLKEKKGLMSFKGFANAIRNKDYKRAAEELQWVDPTTKNKETNLYKQLGPKEGQLLEDSRVGKYILSILNN